MLYLVYVTVSVYANLRNIPYFTILSQELQCSYMYFFGLFLYGVVN